MQELISAFYNAIGQGNPELAQQIHDEGYSFDDKKYKPFTYSRLYAHNKCVTSEGIIFYDEVFWQITSAVQDIVKAVMYGISKNGYVKAKDIILPVESISIVPEPQFDKESYTCKTLSPVCISHKKIINGKPSKIFIEPENPLFSIIARNNLIRKARALGINIGGEENIIIYPSDMRLYTVTFRKSKMRTYTGTFTIKGSQNLIRLAYLSGLGEKTGQGLGMFVIM
jgi:CRISPR-associated endoribonuclease Cas6